MDKVRRLQKAGEETLLVSIPREYVIHTGIKKGDNVTVSEEADGSLRVVPALRKPKTVKASIRSDLIDSDDLLSRLLVSCYMLGYDTIELTSRNGIKPARLNRAGRTVRTLRGLEIVESSENTLLAQSLIDPAKFPVDSLIKRLQLLVSRSLSGSIESLRGGNPGVLNEMRRTQEDIDELYWLIVRQLLVALSNREISGRIGLESPLHTSGDRISAKMIEEIGRVVLELTEDIVSFKEAGMRIESNVISEIEELAKMARNSFDITMESLLAPDIRTIEKAIQTIGSAQQLERLVAQDTTELGAPDLRRIVLGYGQLARYCGIIVEVSMNRLLRKTSRICVVTSQ